MCLYVGNGATGELTKDQANRAVRIVLWCLFSYLQILNKGRLERKMQIVQNLRSIAIEAGGGGGASHIKNLEKNHGYEHDQVRQLAKEFPELLMVEILKHEHGGRTSEVLRIPVRN